MIEIKTDKEVEHSHFAELLPDVDLRMVHTDKGTIIQSEAATLKQLTTAVDKYEYNEKRVEEEAAERKQREKEQEQIRESALDSTIGKLRKLNFTDEEIGLLLRVDL